MTAPSTALPWPDGPRLDPRRCAWFEDSGTVVVADLHLGYAWSRRTRGALLPVEIPDDTLERLEALHRDYAPRRWVILGDIVHEALDLPAIERALRDLCGRITHGSELIFCLGNHDRHLEKRLKDWNLPVQCHRQFEIDGIQLLHGDAPMNSTREETFTLGETDPAPARCMLGHEHPAITLGDGVATRVKCPAFLVGDRAIILPAFSAWAAGCEWKRQPFLGPIARSARFHTAFACAGTRLLPVPLGSVR
jgi:putative SbcD/Mre11-related phosphoesterase